jgi:hypothetical protein
MCSTLVSKAQISWLAGPESSKTEKGSEGPGRALSAGVHTAFLLEREDLGTSLLLFPGKMFRQGYKNALSLLWHIHRFFILTVCSRI